MTVKELIEHLDQLPPEAEILYARHSQRQFVSLDNLSLEADGKEVWLFS